jgi:CheY-like chemotaxis protein
MHTTKYILVVDDDLKTCEHIRALLKDSEYIVDTANSGVDAINKSKMTTYDLALVDLCMPEMNGIEIIQRIREESPNTKFITLAEYSVNNMIGEAFIEGTFDCVHKPIDRMALRKLVLKKLRHELSTLGDTGFKLIKILIASGEQATQKIISEVLEELGFNTVIVSDGLDAVKRARDGSYKVIIIDANLPKLDGVSAFAELKEVYTKSQFIMIGGYLLKPMLTAAKDIGVDEYLTKPVKRDQLLEAIQRATYG